MLITLFPTTSFVHHCPTETSEYYSNRVEGLDTSAQLAHGTVRERA